MDANARLLNEAKQLEARWATTGLLDGIEDSFTRSTTAVLLENQRLINETSTDTGDVSQFKRISIPLVRRIYPQLIANKVVSVQPLLGPTGLVYYLRFRYSSNKGAIRGADNNGGFPGDDANSLMQTASGDPNLDIFYSHQFVQNESTSTDAGGDVTSVFSPLEHTPILAGTVTGTAFDGGVAVATFVIDESGTATITDIGTPAETVDAISLNNTTGEMTFTWSGDPGSNNAVVSYEYNMECNPDLPEINLVVESEDISAKTRKLKAVWSYEAQQDLRSQHNLDAEAELTGVLAQEINLEIDREVLTDLRQNAGTVASWDFNTALGDTIKELIKLAKVELPDDFMKRWLMESNEGKITQEQLDSQYDNYAQTFKWQLLEGELLKEHKEAMEVKDDEVRAKVAGYFQAMGGASEMNPQIDGIIDQVLSNPEEKQKIFNDIQDEKLIKLFKENISSKKKSVTKDKFIEIASKID